ncbi:phosphonopyruvate decarboxylase [Bacteroides uniformis]|uniref:phosphonopyruvate decarboxylase n=1 Tax=Bacteroides uniformis TaxID=820 RepID=UPI001D08A7FC|nr:phosphonopyruvate decarboxylase [Bacteroides uniformis]MCB6978182.1 phosphonopyruvate decarboxylase [Bacteroides uniformis]MCB7026882.1 phosphonopyruvate decarboxylase [Bacteroides uniformis]
MISSKFFIDSLCSMQMDFFTGVPDSLLKNVCAYITDHFVTERNVIAANEGAAVGLAAGYYLATKKIPVVYMQNSGLGNAVNPLMSLTDKEVYNIPLLLLVGWRGEPGVKDEPQHIKQGKVTLPLLEAMGIKYAIMSQNETEFLSQLSYANFYMNETHEPFAFVIPKGTFEEYKLQQDGEVILPLKREAAIQLIASSLSKEDIIVSTTGMISRELFEYRTSAFMEHEKDFLTVGSMGHASQIALGIALEKKKCKVFCFDGDGSTLMHMGSLAIIGSLHPDNYVHVIFNNGAHDSVGGQPTVAFNIDLCKIAQACGYEAALSVSDSDSLCEALKRITYMHGPILLEVKVRKGARKDLGRPTTTPLQNKDTFMLFLNNQ